MPPIRFCSACGAELPAPPPVACAACWTSHWRNPKPCANAIVVEDGKVLLVRRAHRDSPWRGQWCAPGGFCEVGEHPIRTAERETYEETGVRIRVTAYLGVWVDAYADAPTRDDAEVINVAYYLAAPVDGATPGEADPAEVSDVAWFAWNELPVELAPPGTLEPILDLARAKAGAGRGPLPELPDRPR